MSCEISIIESFKEINASITADELSEITFDHNEMPTFHFVTGESLCFKNCTWRLEKNKDYVIGYLDHLDDSERNKMMLSSLVGQKLKKIGIANAMYDAQFMFTDQYMLKTFSCCPKSTQWEIRSKERLLFSADIQIKEDQS